MKALAPPPFSETVDQVEINLLSQVLCWKLSYTTPYDFIPLILQKISINIAVTQETLNGLASKADKLCEFLYLCIY